jgi:hypothetical protein
LKDGILKVLTAIDYCRVQELMYKFLGVQLETMI